MSSLIEQIDALYAAIGASHPKHREVEDGYYSCPLSAGGCDKSDINPDVCTCGAAATITAMRQWQWELRLIRDEVERLAVSEQAYHDGLNAAREAVASLAIVAERTTVTPSFIELQQWALANGWSGATDQQAFAAWKRNCRGPGFPPLVEGPL